MALANSQWQVWMVSSLFYYFWVHWKIWWNYHNKKHDPKKVLNIISKLFPLNNCKILLHLFYIFIVQLKPNSPARPRPQLIWIRHWTQQGQATVLKVIWQVHSITVAIIPLTRAALNTYPVVFHQNKNNSGDRPVFIWS